MAETWYVPILSSVLSGLVGAAVVYYFGIRQLKAQRRINFLERQLSEFYAPLAGMRQQIQAKGELRLKVSAAANAAWLEICQSYRDSIMHDREERFAPFNKIIVYENKQLESELVPVYRQVGVVHRALSLGRTRHALVLSGVFHVRGDLEPLVS